MLLYVEHLEQTIEKFRTHTKKKYYLGIQRQLDILADEMLDEKFKVSMVSAYEFDGKKQVKVDNGFESFFDMLTKGEAIIKAMQKFEVEVFPKEKDDEIKPLSEDSAENYLKSNGATKL